MSTDAWMSLLILTTAIVLFITEIVRVDVVALGVMVALMVSGILTPEEALSGFSNPVVLTLAALFIIGGAVTHTGLAGTIGRSVLRIAGSNPLSLTLVIMLAVALLSAFMSDAGTVAVLLPAVTSLALSANLNVSKLLIPLSFGSLLGGATTLIGTPPNLIVSDLLLEQGLQPFTFFDFSPIGLIVLAAGVMFMLLIGRKFLPEHRTAQEFQRIETPEELMSIYRLPDNLFQLRVRRGSILTGKSISESELRSEYQLSLLEVRRPSTQRVLNQISGLTTGNGGPALETLVPSPGLVFEVDDILIAQASPSDVSHAAALLNLGVLPVTSQDHPSLITNEIGIAEILIPPRSALTGKTIVDVGFGSQYQLTVLGINQPGKKIALDLKQTRIQFGDTLLVQGPWKNILALKDHRRDFVVMGQPESMIGPPARNKAPLTMLILVGMLIAMITNLVPVVTAALLAALLMILSKCLTIDQAYESVDWKSIVLIAGMLPMSIALEQVGVISIVSQGITNSLGTYGPVMVMAGLFLITSAFTQVLSNTATTVLIAPIGFSAAQNLDIQPYAFLMAIAIAASMAFATPVASPVNTLVMGTGSYRFGDYLKVGIPMIIVTFLVSMMFLPVFWPF
jgi:di/tricarboxylate transporter